MAKKNDESMHIEGGQISAGRDIHANEIVGRDKVTIVGGEALAKEFSRIYQTIDARPADPKVDKSEIKETVQKIEAETKKGEQANADKVERWLKFLAGMSDDIFQVVTATLANPALGIGKAVQLIAKKAQSDK